MSSSESSWGKRRSLFALPVHDAGTTTTKGAGKAKRGSHRRAPSLLLTDLHPSDLARAADEIHSAPPSSTPPTLPRPPLSVRNTTRRTASTDLKLSWRSSTDDLARDVVGEPLTTSSSTVSMSSADGKTPARTVLLHGDVQTSAGMFRKKKEYLVLTETHIIRLKSQARAAEMFKMVSLSPSGRPSLSKHISTASQPDLQTISDSSGDKEGRVPLRHVVAVYRLDDGKPHSALEICYLDEDAAQPSALLLGFSNADERDVWLKTIRNAANDARLREENYISSYNIENAARIVERAHDYDPTNCAIFKVVQRHSATKTSRTSSEELLKIGSTVCFLAVGVHKIHLIQIVKPTSRGSSPSLSQFTPQTSHGILTLTAARVSDTDDTFELTFRQPLQPARFLYLASSASLEIAARIHFAENFLRPECAHRLFKFSVPAGIEHLLPAPVASDEEHCCLDRTLSAYCIAYGVNPTNVRYTINYTCEDAPRFELLPPADAKRPDYGPIALLAIMRALRYNESFGSISFAGVDLDSLNGLHDNHGQELVCSRTKRGTPIRLTIQELSHASLLVQEIRALAVTSKKLRRMDFSGCISATDAAATEALDDEGGKTKDIGCGIVEALVPLCKHQTTNVDWICLNGIQLSDTDLDYLVGAAVDKSCHFRAIELNRCGLDDRSMGLILDALRAQDNTIEAVEIAGNTARLDPITFDSQLSMFGFVRKLDLSYISRTSGSEPLLTAETLLIWRLQVLRLSGTALNPATIDAVATYLAHPQSKTLHELYLDNAYLSGRDVATILHSLTQDPENPRDLHLDISQNYLARGLEAVTKAIADGFTPSQLSMRSIEYREETLFRRMLAALTSNKTIRYLDMSQTALQGDAGEETCRALHRFLADNNTLVELDLSGEDSRLSTFMFGSGINEALTGLKHNKSIQTLRVEKQKLGLQGASTLAEVLKENAILRELHCGSNEIPLHGLTDLVNSLIENTTLIYLPTMDDGREAALKSAEATMKGLPDLETAAGQSAKASSPARPAPANNAIGVRRGLNSVRRTAARAASAYTPSFPALPSSSGRSTPAPDSTAKNASAFSITLPPTPNKTRRSSQTPVAASPLFTVQDIQITHRLLTEQWDRQCYRLQKYLERNWNILHGIIPEKLEIEDEKFERPESVGSIAKVLEQVKRETTPRIERELYFDPASVGAELAPIGPFASLATGENDGINPEQLQPESVDSMSGSGTGTGTPHSASILAGHESEEKMQRLELDDDVDDAEEPTTPTQPTFNLD